jgi:phage terminase large subunit
MIDVQIPTTIVFEKNHDAVHDWFQGKRRYRYIINEGSSRSSKTRSIIQLMHKYALENKGKRLSVWRDTKKDCRDTVGADVKNIFPHLPLSELVTFNKTEAIYYFPTGSVFEINGTDEPNKLHGYNCHVSWFNEPYDISKDTFDQLDMRTEDFVIIDWNPQLSHWIDELKKDARTLVIHSTFKDNPFCPPEQKLKILSYQPVKMCAVVEKDILPEAEAKAYNLTENPLKIPDKLLTELSRCKENERKMSASAYKWSVYGLGRHAEKPNRIFFWEEISDDDYNKIDAVRYYGVDWGVVDPWGILEVKYYDGDLYFHERNYSSENQIKEALTIHELEQVNQSEEGLVKFIFKKLSIPTKNYIVCDTNRITKIIALQQGGWEYSISAPKPPGSIIDGINLLSNRKVYFTSSSKNLKYEQENYSRMVDRFGTVLEEPEDLHNHLMDPARYVALFLFLQGVLKN